MATSSVLIRIDDNLKKQAFKVFEQYGMTATQAVKMFLTEVANTRKIPLHLDYDEAHEPNEETQRAILESRADGAAGKLKSYSSNQEMYEDLKREFINE